MLYYGKICLNEKFYNIHKLFDYFLERSDFLLVRTADIKMIDILTPYAIEIIDVYDTKRLKLKSTPDMCKLIFSLNPNKFTHQCIGIFKNDRAILDFNYITNDCFYAEITEKDLFHIKSEHCIDWKCSVINKCQYTTE